MSQAPLFRLVPLVVLVLFAPVLCGTAGVAHAFNITFETLDCGGQPGFASVPVEYIYRIDSLTAPQSDVTLLPGRAATQKRSASNIEILNSSIPRGVSASAGKPPARGSAKTTSCPGINTDPKNLRRVSVRRPNLEPVEFDVFYVTAAQAKKLTRDIKRYMAARRTSLERGASITVENR